MATIGRLSVKIDADSTGLTSGLRSAEGGVNSFSLKAGALVDKLKLIGPAAILAGGALGVAMVRNVANTADALGKLSTRTGVAVEDLSRLQYAASLSDVSTEQLSGGITRLSRNMSDAAAGTGEAGKAFEAMGISVANADGTLRAQRDVLNDVADRFATYEDGAQKSALAQQIFGRAGAQMITMLNGGSKALKEMADESDRLGNTIDTKTARSAERFNDNITRLNTAVGGMSRTIAGPVIQSLADLSDSMFEAYKQGKGLLGVIDAIIAGPTGKRKNIQDAAEDVKRLWIEYNKLEDQAAGQDVGTQAVNEAEMAYSRYMDSMRNYSKLLADQIAGEQKLAQVRSAPNGSLSATEDNKDKPKLLEKPTSTGGDADKAADDAMKKAQAVDAFFAQIGEQTRQREIDGLTSFVDGLKDREDARLQSGMNEQALAEETYQTEYERLVEAKEALALTEEQFNERLLQIRMDRDTRIMDADMAMLGREQQMADQRVAINQQAEKMIIDAKAKTTQLAIGLLSALGAKSKGAALAALALSKAVAISEIFVNTLAAQSKATAQLGIFAGPAVAAIGLQGKIQAGLVAATGLVQAGSIGGGSSVSMPSSGSSPSQSSASGAPAAPSMNQTVTIQGVSSGDLFSGDAVRTLIDKLIDAQRNGARIVLA